jgi:hypothetical protein
MDKRLSIPIDSDTHKAIKLVSARQNTPLSDYCRSAIIDRLNADIESIKRENPAHEK